MVAVQEFVVVIDVGLIPCTSKITCKTNKQFLTEIENTSVHFYVAIDLKLKFIWVPINLIILEK